ncbi:MAG: putative Aurora kinase A, partial [Streblomastix strix]
KGAFGHVFQVYNQTYGCIAAKVIKKTNYDLKEWEIGFLLGKNHENPFVPKYISTNDYGENVVILMEYANLGDLESIIRDKNKILPVSVIRAMLKQLLEGLRIMHVQKLIHRDIKGGNILLHNPTGTEKVVLKIADYGLVKNKKKVESFTEISFAGTITHMAPEMLIEDENGEVKANEKIDIWSTGIIAYQLLTHSYPFRQPTYPSVNAFIIQRKLIRPQQVTNDALWNLLSQLIAFDKKDRLTAEQALIHDFFTNEQAQSEITAKAKQLANEALIAKQNGDKSITQYDTDSSFTVLLS